MGDEGSRRVVDRLSDVLDGIGDAWGAGAADGPESSGTGHSRSGRPVTDGGADEAPAGNGPWADDDPIVFGDSTEDDTGTAILDAVTDEDESLSADASAPPFDGADENAPATDAADVDESGEERLAELEARIGALESDHAQLASQLTDVETTLADLGEEVDRVGEDVRELVTLLGGIALTSERPGDLEVDPDDVAAALATELEGSLATRSGPEPDDVGSPDAGESAPVEAGNRTAESRPVDSNAESTGTATTDAPEDATDDGADPDRNDAAFAPGSVPDGIHRGVGDDPAGSSPTAAAADAAGASPAGASDSPADPEQSTRDSGNQEDGNDRGPADTGRSPDDQARGHDDHARELVDPRTDAVGARLRQFREGFVDDPTEDLPTGSSADEFRFEKVLLPADGEHAPDLSTAELAKPYLESLPDGYAADAVVLEWLDWLVSAADGETAARAICYYESIDWLTGDARDALLGYLDGLGDEGGVDGSMAVNEPPAGLDLQDHLRSLQYVTELATGEVDADGV